MIIRDDADIFDDVSASRLNPVKEKPDYRKLQWIEIVPGLQTYVPVEIQDHGRDTGDESDKPQDEE